MHGVSGMWDRAPGHRVSLSRRAAQKCDGTGTEGNVAPEDRIQRKGGEKDPARESQEKKQKSHSCTREGNNQLYTSADW